MDPVLSGILIVVGIVVAIVLVVGTVWVVAGRTSERNREVDRPGTHDPDHVGR